MASNLRPGHNVLIPITINQLAHQVSVNTYLFIKNPTRARNIIRDRTLWGYNTRQRYLHIKQSHTQFIQINHVTLELNPSAQRCLTRFFTGDFASWTVYFVNICVKTNKYTSCSFSLLIMYGSSHIFRSEEHTSELQTWTTNVSLADLWSNPTSLAMRRRLS
jgi:hypothetical protein